MQRFFAAWSRSVYLMGSLCLALGVTGLQAQELVQGQDLNSPQQDYQGYQQEGHQASHQAISHQENGQMQTLANSQEAATAGQIGEGKININLADANLIAESLEGIGKVRAEAIIRYREESGEFRSLEELGEVSGIGEQTLMRNSERIVFD